MQREQEVERSKGNNTNRKEVRDNERKKSGKGIEERRKQQEYE